MEIDKDKGFGDSTSMANIATARLQDNRGSTSAANPCLPQSVSPDQIRSAESASRHLANRHYENFLVSSILLPKAMRQPFFNVYAFCRTADDAADESGSPERALVRLTELKNALDQTYRGRPPSDLFIALAKTIDQFQIPQRPFNDLLDAFVQDQTKNRYQTDHELLDYCRRSANPVGRIVLRMGDADSDSNVALSDEVCTALQFVNFWQDVARDYRMNRIYLPLDRLEERGIDPLELSKHTTSTALRRCILDLCDEAEDRFSMGNALVGAVPSWLSTSIRLFIGGGRATIAAIRKIDGDVLRVRPTVSKWTQARLVMAQCFSRGRP
jgi:squalene synthase HpnC